MTDPLFDQRCQGTDGDLCHGHIPGDSPPPGTVLHSVDHTHQALVISDQPYHEGWYLALVFDLNTKQRVFDSGSAVKAHEWRVAENYVLGMDIEGPPQNAVTDHPCTCTSSVCDPRCYNVTRSRSGLCDACQEHGVCTCSCDCEEETLISGEMCAFCDAQPLCEMCGDSHIVARGIGSGLCPGCEEYREQEQAELEEREA